MSEHEATRSPSRAGRKVVADDNRHSTCARCGTLDLDALATCIRFDIVCSPTTCAAELMAVRR